MNTGGRRLWLLDVGAGPPLVFLHGNPSSSFSFRHQVSHFAAKYRVLVPDLLGFGRSEVCPAGATFRDQCDVVEALLDDLELREVRLVVHDWGGPVGLRWAVRHPDRVSQLVLANTTAGPEIDAPLWWRLFTAPLVGDFCVVWANLFLRGAIRTIRSTRDPSVRLHYRRSFPSRASRRSLLQFERLSEFGPIIEEIEAGLQRLAATPCLLLWGEPEIYFGGGLPRLQERFPHSVTAKLPEAGHFLFEDAPEQVNSLLSEFFEKGALLRPKGSRLP